MLCRPAQLHDRFHGSNITTVIRHMPLLIQNHKLKLENLYCVAFCSFTVFVNFCVMPNNTSFVTFKTTTYSSPRHKKSPALHGQVKIWLCIQNTSMLVFSTLVQRWEFCPSSILPEGLTKIEFSLFLNFKVNLMKSRIPKNITLSFCNKMG